MTAGCGPGDAGVNGVPTSPSASTARLVTFLDTRRRSNRASARPPSRPPAASMTGKSPSSGIACAASSCRSIDQKSPIAEIPRYDPLSAGAVARAISPAASASKTAHERHGAPPQPSSVAIISTRPPGGKPRRRTAHGLSTRLSGRSTTISGVEDCPRFATEQPAPARTQATADRPRNSRRVRRNGSRAPMASGSQNQDEDHRGEEQAIDDERLERARLEVAPHEPHREPAAHERGEQRGHQRPQRTGGQARLRELERVVRAGASRDRNAEEKGVPGRRRAVEAAQESRGDRDPGARSAGDEGERLGEADREPLAPGDTLERIAGRGGSRDGAAIGDPHDDRPAAGGDRDDDRPSQLAFDDLSEEEARQRTGNRGDHEDRGQAARDGAEEHAQELAPEVRHERPERAQVHDRVEGEALIGPAEHVGHQDEMPRGRDGQELGQALDDAEDHALRVRHPTMSSPPSTPITLPVIQYVSGWERTTMARATSSVVVIRPLGLRRRASAMIWSWRGIFCRAGVSVTPARTAFAVMPWGPSSAASCRMCDSSAALAADTGP